MSVIRKGVEGLMAYLSVSHKQCCGQVVSDFTDLPENKCVFLYLYKI